MAHGYSLEAIYAWATQIRIRATSRIALAAARLLTVHTHPCTVGINSLGRSFPSLALQPPSSDPTMFAASCSTSAMRHRLRALCAGHGLWGGAGVSNDKGGIHCSQPVRCHKAIGGVYVSVVEGDGRRADGRRGGRKTGGSAGGRQAGGQAGGPAWGQVGGRLRASGGAGRRASARAVREIDYASITHRVAFGGGTHLQLSPMEKGVLGALPYEVNTTHGMGNELVALIEWILARDVTKRPSLEDIKHRLESLHSVCASSIT
ncbi:protein kinase domain-containing protein [Haematococcus lacustris]|uniref:Protein kinase domain-containing protein n=1 Tax=Haematococcus lacustris TaxID=44745 RepID=A0A6A0AET3_HAELA|nr:protein kinase domain-containing protein [Haematococcus lacustris]